jgi:hypothetical protein
MSGVEHSRDREPPAVPPVLQHLAESSREWQPSARVEDALSASWEAAAASRSAGATVRRDPRGTARVRTWAPWGALAASLVAALVWWGMAGRGSIEPSATFADSGSAEVAPGLPVSGDTGSAGPVARPVAVPSGPFGPPPPRPAAEPARDPKPSVSRPAASASLALREVESEEPDPFVWLPGADAIEPGLGLQVVRMTLPNARWDGRAPGQDAVQADVLMGEDGLARAVRVVRTSTRP